MYLVDCFIPVLAYVTETMDAVNNGADLGYDHFRNQVTGLIHQHRRDYEEGGYSDRDYQQGLFAVAAFVDEKVLSSEWESRGQWSRDLLQRTYFNTTQGGVEFFERLDALNPFNPVDRDVREVYFYCLTLGFCGRYYQPGDQAHLAEIVRANTEILCSDVPQAVLFSHAETELLPDGAGPVSRESQHWSDVLRTAPVLIGVPVVAVLALFMAYRVGIVDALNQLLGSL